MNKSMVTQSDEHVDLQINKSDLQYMLQELEKLHEEGGQFILRLQNGQDEFMLFQKVQIDEEDNTEVIYGANIDGIWSSVIFFTLCLFCFIAILYGILQLLS
jgi:hypothetical protein